MLERSEAHRATLPCAVVTSLGGEDDSWARSSIVVLGSLLAAIRSDEHDQWGGSSGAEGEEVASVARMKGMIR